MFRVSDGSTFEVFPNSRLVFRSNASSYKDLLDLFLGRVKVHIQKLGGMDNPNRVNTPTAVISVRGTIFDVVIEDADDTTLVVVDEGWVEVKHALWANTGVKDLYPGDYIRVFRNQPLAQKSMDKSGILRTAMQNFRDLMGTVIQKTQTGSGGGNSGPATVPSTGKPLPGDNGGGTKTGGGTTTPPPAPPPPPPPPPPPGG